MAPREPLAPITRPDPTAAGERRPRLSTALKVTVAVALLALVVWRVDWRQLAGIFADVEPWWLVAAALLTALDRLFMAGKWCYLLRGMGVPVRVSEALAQYLLGSLVSLATQWQLSGDLTRAVGLAQRLGPGQRRQVAASVVFEKIAGFLALALLSLLALAVLVRRFELGTWGPAVVASVAAAAGASLLPLLALSPRARGPLGRLAGRIPSAAVRRAAGKLLGALDDLQGLGRVAWGFLVLTFLEQLVPLVNLYFFKEAFGIELGWLPILAVMPIIQLFTRLPISIEAIGVREGLYLFLFSLVGLSTAESFAIALAGRVVNTLVYGLGGLAVVLPRRRTAVAAAEPRGPAAPREAAP